LKRETVNEALAAARVRRTPGPFAAQRAGRRVDVMALDADGSFTIVEVKSCVADFRADRNGPNTCRSANGSISPCRRIFRCRWRRTRAA
jgi:hypothetical protein